MSVWTSAVRARAWLERPWSERWQQLGRDVAMLGAGLRGERTWRPIVRAVATHGRKMRVVEVVRETSDAVSIVLAPVARAVAPPTWRAGEFLTLGVRIDGRLERRAYSICLPPAPGALPAITVKRVAGGLVSSWLVANAEPGLAVEVGGPSGRFVLEPQPAAARHHLLIAGGSGITPLRAILETVLRDEPASRATLVYGNRGAADVIFAAHLDALAEAHPERLASVKVLSEPPSDWTGPVGVLDAAALERLLAADAPSTEYWLCGPEPMMDAARAVLAARGVEAARVRAERFLSLGQTQVGRALPTTAQPVTFRQGTEVREVLAAPGRTLLEVGLAAGLPMPHSCMLGGCGACRVHLRHGEVAHDAPNCLGADEAAAGYALACVARPLGKVDVEVPR
ncbi:MAG: ferredoxin--NADP reductase [Myxococcota bacterium]